jgi:hypothetical protein
MKILAPTPYDLILTILISINQKKVYEHTAKKILF